MNRLNAHILPPWVIALCYLISLGLGEAQASGTVTGTFEVRNYELTGNTLLNEQELSPLFTNAIGPTVSLDQVFKVLAGLHRKYLEHGFDGVAVAIPQQELSDGMVIIKVTEPPDLRHTANVAGVASTGMNNPVPPAFEVGGYDIEGNTILSPKTIDPIFAGAIGKTVTVNQILKAVSNLQLAYHERGFVTVSVTLPPQELSNDVVKVSVIEGTLAVIKVTGNRYFSSNNVVHALPSLQTNIILNGLVFQRELDAANANRDRRIYPTLSPGPDPGTSALELRVKDRLPLHARFDLDNYSTPGTPDLRLNFAAEYDNLWQLEHQMGLFYGFSPEEFKSGEGVSDYFFNRPLIAYYGGYYRLPLGEVQSVQQEINNSANFGYDEASHQYRLPATGARPNLTFYANAASGDTGVQFGPRTIVTNTPLLTLSSQDSGENLTMNAVVGSRLTLPLVVTENALLNISGALEFKRYSLTSFNTNNFPISTTTTNGGGSQTNVTTVSSPQPTFYGSVSYLPLTLGLDFSEKDKSGRSVVSISGSINFIGSSSDFSRISYSAKAGSTFSKFNISLSREQMLPGNWSVLLRGTAQASPDALINNEQFAVGGINSVRGYYEGESYGDSGWFGSLETRTPFIRVPVASFSGPVPAWVRGSVFADYGQRFLSEPVTGLKSDESLLGVGFGLSANMNNHLEMRLAVGWPLLDSTYSRAGAPHVSFTLGGQF